MLVTVYGAALFGIDAQRICIEINVDRGIAYHLVGLPDSAIKESSYRISAALKNSGFRMPGKKITINLAPADLRKEGSAFDLPMAIGILLASEQIKSDIHQKYLMLGELSLDGRLNPVRGVLPIALMARKMGFRGLVLPENNAGEAIVVEGLSVFSAGTLGEVVRFLQEGRGLSKMKKGWDPAGEGTQDANLPDFEDVKGQETVKRCLEIAAAGGHNVLMIGPPGSGKTMLARRLPSILPRMTSEETLESTKIHSVAGKIGRNGGVLNRRPFRSPHHSTSTAALVGGGAYPLPGEISLAHNGVLFLDELPEFRRQVLEALRQPLEDRKVTLSRSRFTFTYPASFMLVASMNPSPGGNFGNLPGDNEATNQSKRYISRISGPLLDRIDLHVEVQPVPFSKLSRRGSGEASRIIRSRVERARRVQSARFSKELHMHCNAQMSVRQMQENCSIDSASRMLLRQAVKDLNLSARAYDRILKISRTIADLDRSENILCEHIAEAIQYRSLDREGWVR